MDRRVCLALLTCCWMFSSHAAPGQTRDPRSVEERTRDLSQEMRYEIGALQYVLYPAQLNELLSLESDYYRRRWIDAYWESRDPNFTTAENEALAEHERRVAFAQSTFFMARWPGWDGRGGVFIRYGAPAYRHQQPAEVSAMGYQQPREYWFYPRHDMAVIFEDALGKGEYSHFLERVKAGGRMRTQKVSGAIDAFNLPGPDGPLAPPSIAVAAQGDGFRKMVNHFEEVVDAMPSAYPFSFEENHLPMVFEVDEFRGGDLIDRVDVNVEFAADLRATMQSGQNRAYVTTAVFWDIDRQEVGRREQRVELPVARGRADTTRLMPAQLTFALPPGFYFMAVTVEEPETGRFSSYRQRVTCRDLESSLALSDIVFASKITTLTKPSPFARGALEVVPHPARNYRSTGPIPVYFEVYNLSVDHRGVSSYTVEYRVVSKTPRKVGFWGRLRGKKSSLDVASSFEGATEGPHDTVHISFGSDDLWVGEYAFYVKVTDDGTDEEISRDVVFRIVE